MACGGRRWEAWLLVGVSERSVVIEMEYWLDTTYVSTASVHANNANARFQTRPRDRALGSQSIPQQKSYNLSPYVVFYSRLGLDSAKGLPYRLNSQDMLCKPLSPHFLSGLVVESESVCPADILYGPA